MTAVLLSCRFALAAVFLTAGVTKLRDVPGTRRAVADFGVPPAAAAPAALLLPVAEIFVAAGLVAATTAVGAATGALVLLALFSAAVAANLAGGRRPDCHC